MKPRSPGALGLHVPPVLTNELINGEKEYRQLTSMSSKTHGQHVALRLANHASTNLNFERLLLLSPDLSWHHHEVVEGEGDSCGYHRNDVLLFPPMYICSYSS